MSQNAICRHRNKLRQNFNKYGVVQDEYLKNLGTTNNIEQTYMQDRLGNKDNGQMNQFYRETKTDKMQELRREIEFLERGMQSVRTRLNRIQQGLLLTSSTSMVGIRPKQLIEPEYHDYLENDQDREQTIHENIMYSDQYDLTEK